MPSVGVQTRVDHADWEVSAVSLAGRSFDELAKSSLMDNEDQSDSQCLPGPPH